MPRFAGRKRTRLFFAIRAKNINETLPGRPRCSVSFHDFKNEISIPYSRILRQSVVVLIPSSFAASARLNARPPEPARSSHAGCFGQPLRRKGPGRRLKFRQYLTQRLHGNGAPVTDNAKPFDQIFKLSHISFPWVLTKKSHALLWYFNRRKESCLDFFRIRALTSSGMSSGLSRSGGIISRSTFRR